MDYQDFFETDLEDLRAEGKCRIFAELGRPVDRASRDPASGRNHPAGRRLLHQRLSRYWEKRPRPPAIARIVLADGAGGGGTRNISDTAHLHMKLEGTLADLHGKEGALLFASGYASN